MVASQLEKRIKDISSKTAWNSKKTWNSLIESVTKDM